METCRSVAREKIIDMKCMSQGISPERLRDRSLKKRATNNIVNSSICPLGNSIQLRRVWGTRLVMDARGREIGGKFAGQIFTAVVGTQSSDGEFSTSLE